MKKGSKELRVIHQKHQLERKNKTNNINTKKKEALYIFTHPSIHLHNEGQRRVDKKKKMLHERLFN